MGNATDHLSSAIIKSREKSKNKLSDMNTETEKAVAAIIDGKSSASSDGGSEVGSGSEEDVNRLKKMFCENGVKQKGVNAAELAKAAVLGSSSSGI